jgi:methionyl-tRNA formyltransferase
MEEKVTNKKIIIIGQGSQIIQLIRELFSIGIIPSNIKVLTLEGEFNLSCIEYLDYFNIKTHILNNSNSSLKIKSAIEDFCPEIVISLSNPFILSKDILELETKFINFHPGILPHYKGSLSTVYSILKKEDFVGGTWHYIDEGIDTGNIIKMIKVPVKNFSAFALNHKIFSLGISSLNEVIEKIDSGYIGEPQEKVGNFYFNRFPDITGLSKEEIKRISYFPPKFI